MQVANAEEVLLVVQDLALQELSRIWALGLGF